MLKDNRHNIDDMLAKKLESYSKEPDKELWNNIKKQTHHQNSFKDYWKKLKGWKKGLFWSSPAILIILGAISYIATSTNLKQVPVEKKYNTEQLLNSKQEPIISSDWYLHEGETIINVLNQHQSLHDILKVNEDEMQNISLNEFFYKKQNALSKANKKATFNFVRNSGFELFTPIKHKNDGIIADEPWIKFSKIKFWETGGIPDYYNTINNATNMWNNTPNSAHGLQSSKRGAGHIGLIAHSEEGYREYRYTKLAKKLIKGQEYCVMMYVIKGDHGPPIKEIGMYFSEKELDYEAYKKGNMPIDKSRFVHYPSDRKKFIGTSSQLVGDIKWMKINQIYTAKGDEEYLYLGSMLPIKDVSVKHTKGKKSKKWHVNQRRLKGKYSYYFMDEIGVFEFDENLPVCDCRNEEEQNKK